MKNLIAALAVALALVAAPARAAQTYVHTSTWTAGGAGTNAFAFQNTGTNDVEINSIEIGGASVGTVTSGIMQFLVKTSTQLVHGGTTQVSFADSKTANATAPSYISASTGPVSVQFEGKIAGASQLAISSPLLVNPDEAATANFTDKLSIPTLILPAGANRAVVLQQKQQGGTDWTAGILFVRIVYTVK